MIIRVELWGSRLAVAGDLLVLLLAVLVIFALACLGVASLGSWTAVLVFGLALIVVGMPSLALVDAVSQIEWFDSDER